MATDTRPHSRACGIRKHDHGPDCHSNCPSCGGVAQPPDLMAALAASFGRGQAHTFVGERGDTTVSVKLRDVYFAVLEGLRLASGADTVDQIDLEGVDEIAVAQNTCVAIEQVVGIYPNVRRD